MKLSTEQYDALTTFVNETTPNPYLHWKELVDYIAINYEAITEIFDEPLLDELLHPAAADGTPTSEEPIPIEPPEVALQNATAIASLLSPSAINFPPILAAQASLVSEANSLLAKYLLELSHDLEPCDHSVGFCTCHSPIRKRINEIEAYFHSQSSPMDDPFE